MITLEYIKLTIDNNYGLEIILRLIIGVPFALIMDYATCLVIYTILLNIIRFTLSFI